jgi:alpha-mannosidase
VDFLEEKISRIIEELGKLENYEKIPLSDFSYIESGYTKDNVPPADNEEWKIIDEDIKFKGEDSHFWIHTAFKTPIFDKNRTLYFQLYTDSNEKWNPDNPQVMLFLNGELACGIDVNHLRCELEYDKEYDMYLYLYKKDSGNISNFLPYLIKVDDATDNLYYDIKVPYDCALLMDTESTSYIEIMSALNKAVSFLDFREKYSNSYYAGVNSAIEYLQKEFYGKKCGKSDVNVYCTGHTHIDVAWLWALAQTREKVQRSFSTVIKLMKKYPEYIFMSSQPQLYKFVKENNPNLYDKIKTAVLEGRWEPEGAMWLEADCNLTGGESIVRQIIFGKKFLKEEFGTDSHIIWLPDAFGYSAALPQIMKKSGIDTFITSKISWNETNKMPYDAFVWQGIDGSEIFSYFLTAQKYKKDSKKLIITAYNGMLEPGFVYGTWDRFQQKEYTRNVLLAYGYGDGGGGPTEEMLKNQKRLSYGIPGMPKTKMSKLDDFVTEIKKDFYDHSNEWNRTPKWVGELYLEYHRGTYTSMAKNKRNNRKGEFLYQTAEIFSAIAENIGVCKYEKDKLNKGWEKILLNQFHDILPGSSIEKVYEDSDKDYEFIFENGKSILKNSITALINSIKTDKEFIVFNPNSHRCSDIITYNGKKMYVKDVPALGWKAFDFEDKKSSVAVSVNSIENQFYKIKFDEKGNIISLYDKTAQRDMVANQGAINRICAYEDYPKTFDAWDINEYYIDKVWNVDNIKNIEPIFENCRAGLKITRIFGKSVIIQNVFLYDDIKRIDFETEADWNEEHILLKAEFDLNVHTNDIICDTQFGNIKRPTYSNTSWDKAKFEICAHKWVDMSESNYGIALMNDCKYGHSVKDNKLTLSLIKCATDPNKNADKGRHSFNYALYTHNCSFDSSDVVSKAYNFNNKMIAEKSVSKNGVSDSFSFAEMSSDDVIIETVKKAEDGSGIIVRMYESKNQKEKIKISFAFELEYAEICNLLEEKEMELEFVDNCIELQINPFEIITLKIKSK